MGGKRGDYRASADLGDGKVMAEHTNIGWCDSTLSLWIGCTKVSVGEYGACTDCYAEAWAKHKYPAAQWGDFPRKRTAQSTWDQARAWNKKAAREGTRPFIFVNSLADIFDNQVDPQWRADAFQLMRETPHLVWLLLTKRPQNIAAMCEAAGGIPDNAAIGCTVVTQREADRDIPHLLAAPTRMFRFVSIEPMMGPIDLAALPDLSEIDRTYSVLQPVWRCRPNADGYGNHDGPGWTSHLIHPAIDWVICGGLSGPRWREHDLPADWARSLLHQCQNADVPFFFKQWPALRPKGRGCELDGREWKDRPKVAPLPSAPQAPPSTQPVSGEPFG